MNEELVKRAEGLRIKYNLLTSENIEGYFDPILFQEICFEDLCKGHIICDKLKVSSAWIPVSSKFDNWFGSVIESNVVDLTRTVENTPLDCLFETSKKNVKISINGKNVNYNHINEENVIKKNIPPGNNVFIFNRPEGNKFVCMDLSEYKIEDCKFEFIKSVGFSDPSLIGTLIRIAHYSCFYTLGYQSLFTASGFENAQLLKNFYSEYKDCKKKNVKASFWETECNRIKMIFDLGKYDPLKFYGLTAHRNQVPFAFGVPIPLSDKLNFIIFSLGDIKQIETYAAFWSGRTDISDYMVQNIYFDEYKGGYFNAFGILNPVKADKSYVEGKMNSNIIEC